MQNGANCLATLDITMDELVDARAILDVRRSFRAYQAATKQVRERDRILREVEHQVASAPIKPIYLPLQ